MVCWPMCAVSELDPGPPLRTPRGLVIVMNRVRRVCREMYPLGSLVKVADCLRRHHQTGDGQHVP